MRLLITGSSGQLGAYLLRALRGSTHEVAVWSGSRTGELFGRSLVPVDFADPARTMPALEKLRAQPPDVIIHAGAMASIAACHAEPGRAEAVNAVATDVLAMIAARGGTRLIHVSTDLVFDGTSAPYREDATRNPLSTYAATKVTAEDVCLRHPRTLIVRLGLLFGPSINGRGSFFDTQVDALRTGKPLRLFEDEWRTPLSLNTAATALLALAASDCTGLLHLGGPERMSRLEMGQRLARFLNRDPALFVAAKRDDAPAAAPRPRDTSLDSTRWSTLFHEHPWPTFESALREFAWDE